MRKLENKKLDEIGGALVKADVIPIRDLETIADDPELFAGVRTRIASASARPDRSRSIFWPGIAAFAGLALVAVAAFALIAFRQEANVVTEGQLPMPAKSPEARQFREPDRVVDTKLPPVETPERAGRISNKPTVRSERPKKSATPPTHYEGEFYALSYAGDPNETDRGGRIIRVDMPRSALFAMGVDIPLENEADMVKADLLVGTDGVTRAIRVIR